MLKMAVTIVLDAEVPLQGNGLPLPEALVNLNEVPAWRGRNTWRTIWTRCDAALVTVTTEMPR